MSVLQSINEEPVQFMLVAAHAGFNLVTMEFQPCIQGNDTLIGGFLTALSQFVYQLFSQPLDSIKIGNYTLLLKIEHPFLISYVFKGQTNSAIRRLKQFVKALRAESHLWNSLNNTILTGAINHNDIKQVKKLVSYIIGRNSTYDMPYSRQLHGFTKIQPLDDEYSYSSFLHTEIQNDTKNLVEGESIIETMD